MGDVKTVEGKSLHVTRWGSKVSVGPDSKDLKNVIKADNKASNGVVHIIDGVLLPPSTDAAVPELQSWRPNIVQLAEHIPDLSTLVSAVVAAGLADTLSSAGKFTVFAPTNEAFKALPAGTLANLMKPENKAKTVEGKLLHVQEWGGKVHVGPSLLSKDLKNVIKADNLASNGVVHIIDGVLLPPAAATIMV